MKFQTGDGGWCGPLAIVNALRCLGKRVAWRTAAKAAGTDPKIGTNEFAMMGALRELGFKATAFTTTSREKGIEWLDATLLSGPALLCVYNWGHWIVAVGKVGNRYVLIDSSQAQRNVAENGIHVVKKGEVSRLWYHKLEKQLFGIAVTK